MGKFWGGNCFLLSDLAIYVAVSGVMAFVCQMSRIVRKLAFCICENKDADQLRGDRHREADQRLCFRYTDSTIPLLPRYEITSL